MAEAKDAVKKEETDAPVMKFLDKDEILSHTKLRTEPVEVPEWGGWVNVRELTGEERDAYEAGMMKAKRTGRKFEMTPELRNVKARLAVLVIVDETGKKRVFSDGETNKVGKLSSQALTRICDVAERLSGLSDEEEEKLEGN